MLERRSIWLRVLAGVLLVAVLTAAGFFIFRAGQANGMALAQSQTTGGQAAPGLAAPYALRGHGLGMGSGRFFHPFGLFFLCLAPFLFLFLAGFLFRMVFWGRPWHHGYGPHHWHGQPPAGDPHYWPGQPPAGNPGPPPAAAQPPQPPAPEPPAPGQPS